MQEKHAGEEWSPPPPPSRATGRPSENTCLALPVVSSGNDAINKTRADDVTVWSWIKNNFYLLDLPPLHTRDPCLKVLGDVMHMSKGVVGLTGFCLGCMYGGRGKLVMMNWCCIEAAPTWINVCFKLPLVTWCLFSFLSNPSSSTQTPKSIKILTTTTVLPSLIWISSISPPTPCTARQRTTHII